jgi:hypothetical protein
MEEAEFDWVKFFLHFIFGVFLGFLALFSWWKLFSIDSWASLLWLPLLIGIIGGIYGDRFWKWFLKWFPL